MSSAFPTSLVLVSSICHFVMHVQKGVLNCHHMDRMQIDTGGQWIPQLFYIAFAVTMGCLTADSCTWSLLVHHDTTLITFIHFICMCANFSFPLECAFKISDIQVQRCNDGIFSHSRSCSMIFIHRC